MISSFETTQIIILIQTRIMKSLYSTLLFVLLVSCGVSDEERMEIATLTCNVMAESRNMDAAFRIKELNSARELLGEDRFLYGDSLIVQAFSFDLCKELVLNQPNFKELLENKKKEYYDELSRINDSIQIVEETQRKKEKEVRERLEQQRIQKQLDNKIRYENERMSSQEKWRENLESYISGITLPPIRLVEYSLVNERLILGLDCNQDLEGLRIRFIIKFKGELEDLRTEISYCGNIGLDRSFLTDQHITALGKVSSNPKSIIENVVIEIFSAYQIKGRLYSSSATSNRIYFPQHYNHLYESDNLDEPIVYQLKF